MVHSAVRHGSIALGFCVLGVVFAGEARADKADALSAIALAAQKACVSEAPGADVGCQLGKVLDRCSSGEAEACLSGARLALSRDLYELPKGPVGRALLLRACFVDPHACVSAARLAVTGFDDADLAKEYLRIGCARSAGVCRTAAGMYVRGYELPRDLAAARGFVAAACARGDRSSCAAVREP